MAAWTAGILLALGLAWFVGAVAVPVVRAHLALSSLSRADIAEADVIERLGGRLPACRALSLHLRCPGFDARERGMAAWLLKYCGSDAVPPLRRAMGDDQWYVRRCAALALGEIGPGARAAEPELGRALRDNVPDVQLHAAWAMVR
jgi:HEAT repeat protein